MVTLEKEQHIRKLLKQGRPWNEITKEVRCSPNTIKKVEEKSLDTKSRSNRSKALKMYENRSTPLEVAIKLDISADEAENYKIEYWKLNNMYEFEQMYKDHKDSLPFIISRFHEMKERNISIDQLSEGLKLYVNLPKLRIEQDELLNSKKALANEYKQGQQEYRELKHELSDKRTEVRRLGMKLRHVNREKKNLAVST